MLPAGGDGYGAENSGMSEAARTVVPIVAGQNRMIASSVTSASGPATFTQRAHGGGDGRVATPFTGEASPPLRLFQTRRNWRTNVSRSRASQQKGSAAV